MGGGAIQNFCFRFFSFFTCAICVLFGLY